MRVLFAQVEQAAREEVLTVDWLGLLLKLGLCVCPVILLIAAILAAIIMAKRKPKPPQ